LSMTQQWECQGNKEKALHTQILTRQGGEKQS